MKLTFFRIPCFSLVLLYFLGGCTYLPTQVVEESCSSATSNQWQETRYPFLLDIVQNGKTGFIDATGKIIIQPQFDDVSNFFEGRARFIEIDKKTWGLIDGEGNIVVEPKFDEIKPFSEGRYAAARGGKWGYIDRDGELIIEPKFSKAEKFSEGRALVKENDRYRFIDLNGNFITEEKFVNAESFSEGLAAVVIQEKNGSKQGFIDRNGDWAIELENDVHFDFVYNINSFKNGRALVFRYDLLSYSLLSPIEQIENRPDRKWGFIDRNGETVIPFKYDVALPFSDCLASVRPSDQNDDPSKIGLINIEGQEVVEPVFDSIWYFSEGLATIEVNKKHGYIDKKGQIVIEPKFDKAYSFSEGLAPVKIGDQWGYIDRSGQIVIEVQFDRASTFSRGVASVNIGDKRGYIDRKGEYIWLPTK